MASVIGMFVSYQVWDDLGKKIIKLSSFGYKTWLHLYFIDMNLKVLILSAFVILLAIQIYIVIIVNSLYVKFKTERIPGEQQPLII